MLEVRLLGKFEVSRDGQLVEISSHPAQLLLAYLILNAGTAHRREKLAGLLWPDSLEETARNNLRQTLWRLQKAVGKDYFVAERTSVAFNTGAEYWLDVDRLRDVEVADARQGAGARSIEALKTYTEMRRIAQQADNRTMELAALMAEANLYATSTTLHDLGKGQLLVEEALSLARQAMTVVDTQLPMCRVYVCGVRAELHMLNGNLARAEAVVEQGYNDPNREAFPAYFMLFRKPPAS